MFTSKRIMHDWVENHGNGLVLIMETMLQQKRQIENLDVKCNILSHWISNLAKDSVSELLPTTKWATTT